jgi:hypothetical protein
MLSTSIVQSLADDRAEELRTAAEKARNGAGHPRQPRQSERHGAEAVTIRLARAGEERALERLAQLDSARTPQGDVLVAEVAGELRAAYPVRGGRVIADPFHPTAGLTSMLVMRARQLRAASIDARSEGARRLVALPTR